MKTLFNLIAVVAIVNLLVLGGIIGYMVVSGRLNTESATTIAKALRGEKLVPATAMPAATASAPATTQSTAPSSASLDMIEMQTAMLDRQRRALEVDRYTRLTDAQLKLLRDREAFSQEQEIFHRQMSAEKQTTQDEGFAKALATYSKLPPKAAKDDFMKSDTEVVVRYLTQMPERTRANILKEFKTDAEKQKRLEIMERIRTQQTSDNTTPQPREKAAS